jgi:predicted component of type VI protein secretion system
MQRLPGEGAQFYGWIALQSRPGAARLYGWAGDGSFQLQTKIAGQPIQEYPQVDVTQGAAASLALDDQTDSQPLQTADGQTLAPVGKPLPAGSVPASGPAAQTAAGSQGLGLVLAGGGILACCAVTGLALVAGVILISRRRRKPQPHPQPAAYPPPQARPLTARLVLARGRASHPWVEIPPTGMTIGRDPSCGLTIDDPQASRQHARLDFINGCGVITDLNSVNGVIINGRRIQQQALRHGDQILIGQTTLVFEQGL